MTNNLFNLNEGKVKILLVFIFFSLLTVQSYANENSYFKGIEAELDSLVQRHAPTAYVFEIARNIYNESLERGDVNSQAFSLLVIAHSHYRNGDHYDSVQHYMNVLYKMHEKITSEEVVYRIRYFAGVLELRVDNFEVAAQYIREALNFRRSHGLDYGYMFNTLGFIYYSAGNQDSADYYYNLTAKHLLETDPGDDSWVLTYLNMVRFMLRSGNYSKAFDFLQQANEFAKETGIIAGQIKCAIVYIDYYRITGDLDSAGVWVQKVQQLINATEDYTDFLAYMDMNAAISDYYQAAGNADSVVKYLNNYIDLNDSMQSQAFDKEIRNTQYYYSKLLHKSKLENARQSVVIAKQKLRSTIVISLLGAFLLVLLVYVLIYYYRKRMAGIQREKEEVNVKLMMANQNIVYNEKSITSFALDLVRRNEFMFIMRNEINALMKLNEEEIKEKLVELLVSVNTVMSVNENSKEVLEQTGELSQAFFAKLEQILPNITNKEKRLCALIQLGLSQKEISVVLNISTNSVNSSTYRLKKRFGLSKEENFRTFLNEL